MKRILPPSSKMRTITKEKQSSLQLKPPQAPRYVKVLPKYKWTSRTDFCLLEHRVLKNIITVEKPLERSSGQTVALSISDSLCPMAKHQSILGNCFKWKQSQGHSSTYLCADLHWSARALTSHGRLHGGLDHADQKLQAFGILRQPRRKRCQCICMASQVLKGYALSEVCLQKQGRNASHFTATSHKYPICGPSHVGVRRAVLSH